MNPEQCLSVVEDLITNLPVSGLGRWLLVWRNEQLAIVAAHDHQPREEIIWQLTSGQAKSGLRTKEWNDLKHRLSDFLHQKGLL